MQIQRYFIACLILCVALLQGCGSDTEAPIEGLYTAITDDGLTLKLRRYRPSPDAPYLTSQPILLFPGMTANMNEYHAFTPEDRTWAYRNMALPDNAPSWAVNDPYIQSDPMIYYSLAHWLYQHGYDVWMANYRGIGRGDFASEPGNGYTNMDVWMSLDTPAAIDKVVAVTGQKPVIGGHSTGGLVCYMYLQGVTMDAATVAAGEFNPHLTSSIALAEERNAKVAGFLGIDPAGVPPLAIEGSLDNNAIWAIMSRPWYINLDQIIGELVMPLLPIGVTSGAISLVFNTVSYGLDVFSEDEQSAFLDIFGALNFWEVGNMSKYVEDFFAREVASSLYIGVVAQYTDWGVNLTFREHWANGEENRDLIIPPAPMPGSDNYYYYSDNMDRMTVPALSFFSENSALVDTDTMVEAIYNSKTPHPLDLWYEVPNTGHVDIAMGDAAVESVFPKVLEWLDQL